MRQIRIVKLIAEGMTNAQIATRLHFSQQSVARSVGELLTETVTANRAELVAACYLGDLLEPTCWPPTPTGRNCLRLMFARRLAGTRPVEPRWAMKQDGPTVSSLRATAWKTPN